MSSPNGACAGSASITTSMSRTYSVPYRFARSEVEVRLTGRTVEIFVRGERVAVHMRGSGNGKHTTLADHMPSSHRRYADWTIGRIRRDAALIGPATTALCEFILERRPHPEQGFRSCLGRPTRTPQPQRRCHHH
jgi:transposase